jgi:hypothetical protein
MANKFFTAIGHFFKKIFGFTIKSEPFKLLVSQLMPVVIESVRSLASMSALSNEEKRKAAFSQIAGEAKSRGLAFGDHMIFLLIEMAVAKLKGTLAEEGK